MVEKIVGAVLALVTVAVVATLALTGTSEAAGALIALLAASSGFYLRGRVQGPSA